MLGLRSQVSCTLLATCLLGCASVQSGKQIRELSTRVADLTRQIHTQRQTLEDLSNRVFILQDRVDANRVAASRRVILTRASAPARPVPRPAARPAPSAPVRGGHISAADRARMRARRRLPVVKLRAGKRAHQRGRQRGRRDRRRGAKTPKHLVLRLTGTPAPVRGGAPLGPVPAVSHRLAVVPLPAAGGGAPSSGAIAEYRAARALLQKRSYDAAALAFSKFIKLNPRHAYADNATYWLAECFWRRGKVRKAAWVLRSLLKQYPSGNKAPSALLKLGLCEQRLGRKARARKVLSQVVQLYPGTREAALAASHLRRLK